MKEIQEYTQNKSKIFIQKISAIFTIVFGLIAIFFVSTPKIFTSQNLDDTDSNFFIKKAQADIPPTSCAGDAGCADSCAGDAGCAGDASSDSGCAGACADGSAGSCACGDGGGCGSGDCTA